MKVHIYSYPMSKMCTMINKFLQMCRTVSLTHSHHLQWTHPTRLRVQAASQAKQQLGYDREGLASATTSSTRCIRGHLRGSTLRSGLEWNINTATGRTREKHKGIYRDNLSKEARGYNVLMQCSLDEEIDGDRCSSHISIPVRLHVDPLHLIATMAD